MLEELDTTFIQDELYSRRDDIHQRYGGQQQGGISTPAKYPYVFLFTGKSGEQFGYSDGWSDDGNVYLYVGEGQRGDMQLTKGNKAIHEAAQNGKQILLFEALGKGKPVKYKGPFACVAHDEVLGPDVDGVNRKALRFHLVRSEVINTLPSQEGTLSKELNFDQLRARAFGNQQPTNFVNSQTTVSLARQRSALVKAYVLQRANGKCEYTGKEAPFKRRDGTPYLEVHHLAQLSDDGLDHPVNAAAIDPTVHRLIHYGMDGEKVNTDLRTIVERKEALLARK